MNEKLAAIAWLECYIKEFKQPNWLSWFGFYSQKERVERAEEKLKALKKECGL